MPLWVDSVAEGFCDEREVCEPVVAAADEDEPAADDEPADDAADELRTERNQYSGSVRDKR